MKLDLMMEYYSRLKELELHKDKFRRLECTTELNGLVDIVHLHELADALIDHVKDAVDLVKDPFGKALVSNLTESGREVATALKLVVYQSCENTFDARSILNIGELESLVDKIFRLITVVECTHGVSMPSALETLDGMVFAIIHNALEVLGADATTLNRWEPMTGRKANRDILRFELLTQQKYFTDDERKAIDDANTAEERARQDALDRAELEERAQKCLADIVASTHPSEEVIAKLKTIAANDMVKLSSLYSAVFTTLDAVEAVWSFDTVPPRTEFMLSVDKTHSDFALLGEMLTTITGKHITFYRPDIYDFIRDTDDMVVPAGTQLAIVAE